MSKRRKRWVQGLAIVALVAMVTTLRGCFVRPGTSYSGEHFNRGHNAAWLGVEWSMEPHSTDEVAALAADLQQRQIDTIFVYVSYLKPTGLFNPTYNHAREFVTALKQAAPQVEVQAWLGIPVKAPPDAPIASGYIDLNDATIQQAIVDFSWSAVKEIGFDGVHLDPEPVLTGDTALLQLLEKVRGAIGPQAKLSISGREITPILPEADLIANRWFTWRADYYREIARRVDQIGVMAYDSHLPLGWLYEQWVRFQVIGLTSSLGTPPPVLFIGLPTSEEHTSSHDPAIENLATGLRGMLAGLNDADARPDQITGVAIYPYWEMSADEWTTYQDLWLGKTEQ
jgi:hypothetical protein